MTLLVSILPYLIAAIGFVTLGYIFGRLDGETKRDDWRGDE